MKAVLMSIQPKWCELIANGKKTVEVRKTKPKLDTPFKVYIYMTKNFNRGINSSFYYYKSGKVIGEFVCDKVFDICIEISKPDDLPGYPFPCTGLTDKEILQYLGNGRTGYGWHISDLVIYDKPKELWDFRHYKKFDWWDYGHHTNKPQWELCNLTRPPQSWCYVEELG